MIKVILAEDHDIMREGLKSLMAGDTEISIVGEAPNGKVLLDILETTPVDIVLMDLNMPVMSGYEATRHIVENFSAIKVLVLSMLEHPGCMQQIINAGAKGYVLKSANKNDLVFAIKQIAKGGTYITPSLLLKPENKETKVKFTNRELQVLELLGEGLTNREIAEKIFLSKRTVETHRKNLIDKTNSKNTSALIKFAISHGILKPD
jgi:DNA-binding NarL/FixJ family response regulator